MEMPADELIEVMQRAGSKPLRILVKQERLPHLVGETLRTDRDRNSLSEAIAENYRVASGIYGFQQELTGAI